MHFGSVTFSRLRLQVRLLKLNKISIMFYIINNLINFVYYIKHYEAATGSFT